MTERDQNLISDVWRAIKSARDDAANLVNTATIDLDRLNDLLCRMKAAGMADHLPTIEDVIAEFRGTEPPEGGQ